MVSSSVVGSPLCVLRRSASIAFRLVSRSLLPCRCRATLSPAHWTRTQSGPPTCRWRGHVLAETTTHRLRTGSAAPTVMRAGAADRPLRRGWALEQGGRRPALPVSAHDRLPPASRFRQARHHFTDAARLCARRRRCCGRSGPPVTGARAARRRERLDGAAPESNRPSRGLHDRTGFEDLLGHRAHAAPRLRLPASGRRPQSAGLAIRIWMSCGRGCRRRPSADDEEVAAVATRVVSQ